MTMHVTRESFPGRPAFDTAVSRALLIAASRGEIKETLRLYRPDRVVAFGSQDAASKHFRDAVRAAREAGFEVTIRLAGGRAAVFHEETIAFARCIPDADPTARTFSRFRETSQLIRDALGGLGVDARIGMVPGEYCPGDYSINARGSKKIAGIGQRIIAGAAHVGGVIVTGRSDLIVEPLVPVYAALGLDWDPSTAGDAFSECGATWDDVAEAVADEFRKRFTVADASIGEETLRLASQLEADHVAPVSDAIR